MNASEEKVLRVLEEKEGNVQLTADALGVSNSYIHRIKKRFWNPAKTTDIVVQEEGERQGQLESILEENIFTTQKLRESVVSALSERIDKDELSSVELVRLFRAIAQYEVAFRASKTPKINDNRTQNLQINQLVDRLADMNPDSLKVLLSYEEEE